MILFICHYKIKTIFRHEKRLAEPDQLQQRIHPGCSLAEGGHFRNFLRQQPALANRVAQTGQKSSGTLSVLLPAVHEWRRFQLPSFKYNKTRLVLQRIGSCTSQGEYQVFVQWPEKTGTRVHSLDRFIGLGERIRKWGTAEVFGWHCCKIWEEEIWKRGCWE